MPKKQPLYNSRIKKIEATRTVSEIKPTLSPIEDRGAFYVPEEQGHPGQLRYSRQNVSEKVDKLREKCGVVAPTGFTPPLKDSVPVIEAPFGYVLVDGHHDVLAALKLGATQIPVRVVRRWKSLPSEEFWNKAEGEGLVYLKNSVGTRALPPLNFKDLVEDPNRYFAAITARKFSAGEEGKSTGAECPLWVKIGKDVPFVEFRISDTMSRHGLLYTKGLENKDPKAFDQLVEKVREVLLKDPIEGLKLVPQRTHYSKIGIGSPFTIRDPVF